jgi:hypothetical protein
MFISAVLILGACSDGDDDISDISLIDPEFNELRISFTDPEVSASAETFVHDAAGDSATTDAIILGQGNYSVSLAFRDIRDQNNVLDMNERIEEDPEEYQVFYEFQNGADSIVTALVYNDFDADDRRLGLSTGWTISAPTGGGESVRIFLVSNFDKQAAALSDNEYDQSMGGEIELEAVFELDIE